MAEPTPPQPAQGSLTGLRVLDLSRVLVAHGARRFWRSWCRSDIDQMLADPQIDARELMHTLKRDDGTPIKVIGYPVRFSRTPASYRAAPPPLGRDTESVLAEILGLDAEAMSILNRSGVIADVRRR